MPPTSAIRRGNSLRYLFLAAIDANYIQLQFFKNRVDFMEKMRYWKRIIGFGLSFFKISTVLTLAEISPESSRIAWAPPEACSRLYRPRCLQPPIWAHFTVFFTFCLIPPFSFFSLFLSFFPLLFQTTNDPAPRGRSPEKLNGKAETLATLTICQCDVERTKNPQCLMKRNASALNLPSCNLTKKSANFGLTSERASVNLLCTVKTPSAPERN